jgi:ABC-2 type transport system ATP-binding protein
VDRGATVLLSTHVVETVSAVADRVIMLAHGRVVADERVADIGAGGLETLFLERIAASRTR